MDSGHFKAQGVFEKRSNQERLADSASTDESNKFRFVAFKRSTESLLLLVSSDEWGHLSY